MSFDQGRHFGVFEEDGFSQGCLTPPVLAVILDLALFQEEFDASGVTLGRGQMKRCSAVIIPQVHVYTLVVGTGIKEGIYKSQQIIF